MHRREGNIKIDIQELEKEGIDWIHLAQDQRKWQAVVTRVMNL
jgi:hypothetical protein